MSKSIIGDQLWAEMSESQKVEAVFAGHATLKQMSEGLLDGSEQLRNACREYLAETGSAFENLPVVEDEIDCTPPPMETPPAAEVLPVQITRSETPAAHEPTKQRFGLPQGFQHRPHGYVRTVLLDLNVYRLPDGQEFIPSRPTGTLGANRHQYALLTTEQFLKGRRGSVYVRTDGKIFDYSIDSHIPQSEIFDTGYTIADLERTGRYGPEPKRRRKRAKPTKLKRAAAAASRQ
jgi:hypothetical protein